MRVLLLLALLVACQSSFAVVYINCGCSNNGDGTGKQCADYASGPGAKNVAVTTVSASTEYSYAAGSTCTLASTSVTVNQNAVSISKYGDGVRPRINGGSASYALSVTTSNGFSITGVDWGNGVTGAVNLSATTTGGVFSNNAINSSLVGIAISAAGAANITGTGNEITCTGATSICVNIATNGGGVAFSRSKVSLTASDRTSTSLIGVRLSGAPTILDGVDVDGGNMGVEIRTTDGHTVKNGNYSGQLVAGVRIRDSNYNRVVFNKFQNIDNLVAYPSGQGNAIDLIDVSTGCGGNMILGNQIHAVYQGIVELCDIAGGGNFTISNELWDYSVDGVSYQTPLAMGYIVGNSLSHYPRSLVGHAIAVQNGAASTMSAYIADNACVVGVVGNNVQCISIPNSANTGPIFLNNNDWHASVAGAHLGKLDTVSPACASGSTPAWCNYDTLTAWQTALGTDADTTGDDAQSISANPMWRMGFVPSVASDFCPYATSPLIGAGLYIGAWITDSSGTPQDNPANIGSRGKNCGARVGVGDRGATSR